MQDDETTSAYDRIKRRASAEARARKQWLKSQARKTAEWAAVLIAFGLGLWAFLEDVWKTLGRRL